MTAITAADATAPAFEESATALDRTLLRAASSLGAYVVVRVQRRREAQRHRALIAQTAAGDARRHAEALAAMGMLPR